MSYRPGIKDLKKKLRKRLNLWLGSFLILLLADEYLKEGYLFDPQDVLIPGTHENLIIVVILTIIINNVVKRNGEES